MKKGAIYSIKKIHQILLSQSRILIEKVRSVRKIKKNTSNNKRMQLMPLNTLLDRSSISKLSIEVRQKILENMSLPKKIGIPGSALMFHVHSVIEDSRIRKFKEPWTIEWLRNLPADAVLYDVGANIGITSLIPAESPEKNIKVVAIEPSPANFASLVKNIELNSLGYRVYALPIGLGAQTDIASFNLTTNEPGGALHSFGDIIFVKPDKSRKIMSAHHCMRIKLDDLVEWPGISFPTHIKVDIDGGEMDLLLGASRVIHDPRCRSMQIEVVDIDENYHRSKEIIELMSEAGFIVAARHMHNKTFPRVTDIQFSRQ